MSQVTMKQGAHTPGPWRLNDPHAGRNHVLCETYHSIDGGIGFLPDDPAEQGFGVTGYMTLADARLMAAAPEMFKTLSDLDGWLANTGHDKDHPWRVSIRAAIEKATGLAPVGVAE
jgi:hypothetical protein